MKILCAIAVATFLAASGNGCSSSSSAQAPQVVQDSIPTEIIYKLVALRPDLVLVEGGNASTSNPEIWVSDRSSGEVFQLTSDAAFFVGSNNYIHLLPPIWNGHTFFTPSTGVEGANSYEVWITDGTIAGTRLLIDLSPDPATRFLTSNVAVTGDQLFVGGIHQDLTTFEVVGDPVLVSINLE